MNISFSYRQRVEIDPGTPGLVTEQKRISIRDKLRPAPSQLGPHIDPVPIQGASNKFTGPIYEPRSH